MSKINIIFIIGFLFFSFSPSVVKAELLSVQTHPKIFSQVDLNSVQNWFALLDYSLDQGNNHLSFIAKFDMAIFDADHHPVLDEIKKDFILIAYVSLGEAESYRPYWEDINDASWIIRENPNWQENYYVDIRNSQWQQVILEKVIPGIISQGFHGIFMDTLDTAEILEEGFEGRYCGAKEAMIQLIVQIRKKYPELLLISNNGFYLLNEIAPYLNGMLVEDIHMLIDFKNDSYKRVSRIEREEKIQILQPLMNQYDLPVFVIDYVDSDDKRNIRRCIKSSKKLGFKPYVAEKNLDKIYAH